MIKFTLKCSQDHHFESWFGSSEDFEKVHASGFVTCPDCGDANVVKSLMAPKVRTARKAQAQADLRTAKTDAEKALAALRKDVEDNSEYVGLNFATEARAMHDGETEHRAIYGEAKLEEAKALVEEGVPVAPLPFVPKRKTN